MSWTVSNPVSIGGATKKSDYDKLWDNCDFLKVEHNTDGTHKAATITSLGLGTWTTPAFNAGNFTANGSMTWTVESADVVTYEYMIIGKTMFLNFSIQNTVVGGDLNTLLWIKIPAGKTAPKRVDFPIRASGVVGNAFIAIGEINISLQHTFSGGNWTAGDTLVNGNIAFEIN